MSAKPDSTTASSRQLGCLAWVVFGLLGVSVLWGSWAMFVWLGFDRAIPIVVTLSTGVLSLISFLVSKHLERQREIEQDLRKSKVVLYETFIAFRLRVIMSGKPGIPEVKEPEIQEFFAATTQQLIVWASDDVLQKYVRFRLISSAGAGKPEATKGIAAVFGDLLLAIRKDMGHSNQGISSRDILATFINDVDTFLA